MYVHMHMHATSSSALPQPVEPERPRSLADAVHDMQMRKRFKLAVRYVRSLFVFDLRRFGRVK
jgi:hypothetical protein